MPTLKFKTDKMFTDISDDVQAMIPENFDGLVNVFSPIGPARSTPVICAIKSFCIGLIVVINGPIGNLLKNTRYNRS